MNEAQAVFDALDPKLCGTYNSYESIITDRRCGGRLFFHYHTDLPDYGVVKDTCICEKCRNQTLQECICVR